LLHDALRPAETPELVVRHVATGEGHGPQETERGQPREPAASSHCSLPPRPPSGFPDGPPSGTSAGSRQPAFPPITVWGETSRLRSAAEHRRHLTGGSGSRRPLTRPGPPPSRQLESGA